MDGESALGVALSRKDAQQLRIEANWVPQKYFTRKKPFDLASLIDLNKRARHRAWLWVRKSLRPRPPSATEQTRDLRAIVSIREPQRKGQTIWLTRSKTQRGGVSTLAAKKSLDSPRMFKINTLPINERALVFQPKRHLSSLEILVSQLSRSTFDVPKYIPKIFVFLTQVRPSGSSCQSLQAPSHKASVLERFSFAPEPDSKIEITLKSANKELSSLTKTVVSSAYWDTPCRTPL